MNERSQTLLWLGQRASAVVLALCVLVHLCTIVYAVRGGLSAAEILARTSGSVAWLGFYSWFVLAVAIHAPIGLRSILSEWRGWRGGSRDWVLLVFGAVLALSGMRAVFGMYA